MAGESYQIKWSGATTNTFGASVNSDAISFEDAKIGAIQISMTGGSPVGTLKLQGSLDGGTNWVDVESSSKSVAAATDGGIWHLAQVGYPIVRVAYTRTSGSTTASGYIFKKVDME